MERTILHLDLDSFFISVERLRNSALEGKPVIVGGSGDRGVVASCSYEARACGVHSAMPMRMALRLCPHAIVLQGDSDAYTNYSRMVTDIIREEVPLFEKASIDEFYADFTGLERFFGTFLFAEKLGTRILKETGLPISFGLSENKTVSKVATGEAKPKGKLWVKHGAESTFMAPLSVKKIPGIGAQTYQTLKGMGVEKVLTLQQIPTELLTATFGSNGLWMHRKAHGIDLSPVEPYSEQKSISTERTFSTDTTDIRMLEDTLLKMCNELCFSLRDMKKLTSCVSVKVRYADFDTHTKQKQIAYTAADHQIIPVVKDLFRSLYQRRLRIRLIGVRFSSLVHGQYQINMFDDSVEKIRLYQAMDKMKSRFGPSCVVPAATIRTKK